LTTARIRFRPTKSIDALIEERREQLHADRRIYIHSTEGASRSYAFRDLLFDGLSRLSAGVQMPTIDESESMGGSLVVRLPARYLECITDIARGERISTNTTLARLVTLGGES
jgi:hypothetical protein